MLTNDYEIFKDPLSLLLPSSHYQRYKILFPLSLQSEEFVRFDLVKIISYLRDI